MATLYNNSIGVIDYPDAWKWYFTITSSEDANNYYVNIHTYLQGSSGWDFSLDLMDKDIWWTLNFDGTEYEIFRLYIKNGQYQNLIGGKQYPTNGKTVTKTYSKTSSAQPKTVKFGTTGSATVYTNMLGTGASVGSVSFTIPSGHVHPSTLVVSSLTSNTNSISTQCSWTDGKNATANVDVICNNTTNTITAKNTTSTFSSLKSNTLYSLSYELWDITASGSNHRNLDTESKTIWTYPVINTPSLSLKSGSEHNTIVTTVSASVSSSYDQFAYSINGGTTWTSWTTSKTHEFTDLSGNTSYTVAVKMKNTSSGYESASKSSSITTWHNPLTNLVLKLTNNWFWYLATNCSYTYTGTISKYEFSIGDDQSFVTTSGNSHSRGSTSPTGTGKLNYNTNYNCQVRLTDNHGRTYTASNTFKTLDERPLYINGTLREVKVIKPDGTVTYVTPNLLTVVKSDGSTVNMNQIINNDSRTQFS